MKELSKNPCSNTLYKLQENALFLALHFMFFSSATWTKHLRLLLLGLQLRSCSAPSIAQIVVYYSEKIFYLLYFISCSFNAPLDPLRALLHNVFSWSKICGGQSFSKKNEELSFHFLSFVISLYILLLVRSSPRNYHHPLNAMAKIPYCCWSSHDLVSLIMR